MPRLRRIAAFGLVVAVLLPASALGSDARRIGSCSGGPGRWELRVARHDGALRVRFRIDDVATGQPWQVFLSKNGSRIYSATKTSTGGEVRVTRRTSNPPGSDRIAASGVNTRTGTTCEGSRTY